VIQIPAHNICTNKLTYIYLLFTIMVKQANEISNNMDHSVGAGADWGVRAAIASQIRCHHMIPLVSQEGYLVAPRIPDLWEAMKQ
jgi:hypothetical protein